MVCDLLLSILPYRRSHCSWTIVYDTEYACQDRRDDAKAGVKSTALLFDDRVRSMLVFFAAIFILSLVGGGILNGHSAVYFVVSCGGTTLHFAWQFMTWDFKDSADCSAKFKVRVPSCDSSEKLFILDNGSPTGTWVIWSGVVCCSITI